MTDLQNAEARRKNAISDLRWYQKRLAEIGIMAMAIPKFADYWALLSEPLPPDANRPQIEYTILLTRNCWQFLHEYDGMLPGAIIPAK